MDRLKLGMHNSSFNDRIAFFIKYKAVRFIEFPETAVWNAIHEEIQVFHIFINLIRTNRNIHSILYPVARSNEILYFPEFAA